MKRAIKDFGHRMVTESKDELVGHFSASDLDEVADLIIQKASDDFLDKALEKRLRTIEAKPLINALARAERLGYEPGDIVDEDQRQGSERVIPDQAMPGQAAHHLQMLSSHHAAAFRSPYASNAGRPLQPVTPGSRQDDSGSYHCGTCGRKFTVKSAYDHVSSSLPSPTTA